MFKDYNFKSYINKGLESINFFKETDIQKLVIPKALNGENIIGKSSTGSGKTHAFILPILEKLNDEKEVQAVIVVPTRELGFQIYDEITKITKFSDEAIDVRLYVGGTNRDNELARLEKSQPQIVIGTIGKLKDLAIEANALKIYTAKMVVIDEADMVFETSEFEEVDYLFARFENPQILAFSATISEAMMHFLDKYLSKNEIIDLVGKNNLKSEIEHVFIPTKNRNKDNLLFDLLQTFHPYLALIFANTKTKVDEIADFLVSKGLKVAKITGNLEPRERKQVLKRIKDGMYQYVVASDLASRGLDVVGVSHVINYELPSDIEFFIHRIGRTARYDLTGVSISFYDYEDDNYLKKLEQKGIHSVYKNLKNGELVVTRERNYKTGERKLTPAEKLLHNKIPVGKKVKPGYKKKRKELINKEARKIRRSQIQEIYKRKAKEQNENR